MALARRAAEMSDGDLIAICSDTLKDLVDDIPYLRELRSRFIVARQQLRAICGYRTWTQFVRKNSRYSMRQIQRLLYESRAAATKKIPGKPKVDPEKKRLREIAEIGAALSEAIWDGRFEDEIDLLVQMRRLAGYPCSRETATVHLRHKAGTRHLSGSWTQHEADAEGEAEEQFKKSEHLP